MVKYWNKLPDLGDEWLIKRIFFLFNHCHAQCKDDPCSIMKEVFSINGLIEVYDNKCHCPIDVFIANLGAFEKHKWKAVVDLKPKLRLYKGIKCEPATETYPTINLSRCE